jgi:RNA polymerase sigma factor (sigma-70 family)
MDTISESGFSTAELTECIPALRSFARRFYASPSDVDDLVQETLAKALSNADKFKRGTRLKSWLFTIMRNHFCTKFGAMKREHVSAPDDILSLAVTEAAQEWSVRGRELEQAVAALPLHYKSALSMIFIEGISYEEASHRCGCPIGTIKSRVSRARESLYRSLN